MTAFLDTVFDDMSARTVLVTMLDILLVYYVIYRVLLTIKGTRAAQMVVGIVLIGASFYVAERLEMTTVSWLLDTFINNFIIIIIVLFQQDIRRGLMRIGQNVVQFGKTHQLAHALDEVLAAAEHLAKARMGGIVVFERDAELKQFVEHGNVIDARVSKELLVSLFVPSRDNELHDGAIIVDKSLRIARAGVVLPLSRSTTLSQKFGTRHRAALGITEETDAVAIVISEERGEISLCVKGNIARDLETDTLRAALQDLFDEDQKVDVAQEAQAAAEISKAMAALAAGVDKSEKIRLTTQPPMGKPERARTVTPVKTDVPRMTTQPPIKTERNRLSGQHSAVPTPIKVSPSAAMHSAAMHSAGTQPSGQSSLSASNPGPSTAPPAGSAASSSTASSTTSASSATTSASSATSSTAIHAATEEPSR